MTLFELFYNDVEPHENFWIFIIIGIIILILILFVAIYLKNSVNDNKRYYFPKRINNQFNTRGANYTIKRSDYDLNSLNIRLSNLETEIRNLKSVNKKFEIENEDLKSKLKLYMDKFGDICSPRFDSFVNKSNQHPKYNDSTYYSEALEKEVSRIKKYTVSFSFEEKNGTVKKDETSDMYLVEADNEYYELVSDSETYGTAIHLEQLQYSYKILNPKDANNKPMRIVKKPIYRYDLSLNKGFLVTKGEVEYQ